MKTEITYNGVTCQCFGKLQENSNFEMVFEDETLDDVWCDGDITGEPFTNWIDAVVVIADRVGEVPLQLEAV